MVETSDTAESLRMLAVGHVDYAVEKVVLRMRNVRSLILLDQMVPLSSHAAWKAVSISVFARSGSRAMSWMPFQGR